MKKTIYQSFPKNTGLFMDIVVKKNPVYVINWFGYRISILAHITAQKMKFSIKDFFSKRDQSRRKLRIWSHFLKKLLIENFIFCAVLAIVGLALIFVCCSPCIVVNESMSVLPGDATSSDHHDLDVVSCLVNSQIHHLLISW